MADRRARRPTVDYSAFNFDDDDDDFVDSSSSSSSRTGSQENRKKKKKTKDGNGEKKENKRDVDDVDAKDVKDDGKKKGNKKELKEIDVNGGRGGGVGATSAVRTLESFLSSPSRRNGERKSLDEKRFERELEIAMRLSKQELPDEAERILTDDEEIPMSGTPTDDGPSSAALRVAAPPADDSTDDDGRAGGPAANEDDDEEEEEEKTSIKRARVKVETVSMEEKTAVVKVERVTSSATNLVYVLPDVEESGSSDNDGRISGTDKKLFAVSKQDVGPANTTVIAESDLSGKTTTTTITTMAPTAGKRPDALSETTVATKVDPTISAEMAETNVSTAGASDGSANTSERKRRASRNASKTIPPSNEVEDGDFQSGRRRSKRRSGDRKKEDEDEMKLTKKEDDKEEEEIDDIKPMRGTKRKRSAKIVESDDEEEEKEKEKEKKETESRGSVEGRKGKGRKKNAATKEESLKQKAKREEDDEDAMTSEAENSEDDEEEENDPESDDDFAAKKKRKNNRKKSKSPAQTKNKVDAKKKGNPFRKEDGIATESLPNDPNVAVTTKLTPSGSSVSSVASAPSTPKPVRKSLLTVKTSSTSSPINAGPSLKTPSTPSPINASPSIKTLSATPSGSSTDAPTTPLARRSIGASPRTPVTPRLAPLTPSSGRSPVVLPPGKCNIPSPASIKHGLSRNARIKPLLSCIERRNPPSN